MAAYPIIAAIWDQEGLELAVHSPIGVVFIVDACLANLADRVALCREHRKLSYVHLDMVNGLSKDQGGIEYLARVIKPEGVITTKPALIKPARDLGLSTVERIFLVDSRSIQTGIRLASAQRPDFLEVMPGIIPDVIRGIQQEVRVPLIAGGMISTKDQVFKLMKAGAIAVSTSKPELWSA